MRLSAADIPERCIIKESGSTIVREERRKKVALSNPQRITVNVLRIDGCIPKLARHPKADFAFIIPAERVWYIELKGQDVEWGMTQLQHTVKAFDGLHAKMHRVCVLVAREWPSYGGGAAKRAAQFKKSSGVPLLTKSMFASLP